MMITLDLIRQSEEAVELLDWPFDFSLDVDPDDIDETKLNRPINYDVIATEGTGGVFVAYGDGDLHIRPLLYGTSEGQAGRIASNLDEWIALLVHVPYWQDVLKFSAGGKLDAMRESAELMSKKMIEEIPDLPEAVSRLRELLPVTDLDDPIALLHQMVHQTDCTLIDDAGEEWETLFNTFEPDRLRRQM